MDKFFKHPLVGTPLHWASLFNAADVTKKCAEEDGGFSKPA